MNLNENAAMPYEPDDGKQTGSAGIQNACAEAERQLKQRKGVHGMGVTKTPNGQDAILVYVEDTQTLSQLPSSISGFPVVGEVTGPIKAY